MKERNKDIIFAILVLAMLILSVIYFSVPERALFMENQIQWWKEWWTIY